MQSRLKFIKHWNLVRNFLWFLKNFSSITRYLSFFLIGRGKKKIVFRKSAVFWIKECPGSSTSLSKQAQRAQSGHFCACQHLNMKWRAPSFLSNFFNIYIYIYIYLCIYAQPCVLLALIMKPLCYLLAKIYVRKKKPPFFVQSWEQNF